MKQISPLLGWLLAAGLVGPTAWSFRVFTVHEAIKKTASLKP